MNTGKVDKSSFGALSFSPHPNHLLPSDLKQLEHLFGHLCSSTVLHATALLFLSPRRRPHRDVCVRQSAPSCGPSTSSRSLSLGLTLLHHSILLSEQWFCIHSTKRLQPLSWGSRPSLALFPLWTWQQVFHRPDHSVRRECPCCEGKWALEESGKME